MYNKDLAAFRTLHITESDDCEKMNASASDAMESAAKSVLLGLVDLRLAFFFPRDETKSERDGAFTVHQ